MDSYSDFSLQTYTKFIRAAETVTSTVHAHLEEHDLTVSQFGVLEAIFHLGPMCQKEIAGKILKSSGNLTMVINNLERRRLVQRRRKEDDRRYITVALTAEGRQLFESAFPGYAEKIFEAMSILSDEEQQQLENICRKFQVLNESPTGVDKKTERVFAVTKPTRIY